MKEIMKVLEERSKRASKVLDKIQDCIGKLDAEIERTVDELRIKMTNRSSMVLCMAVDMDVLIVYGWYPEVIEAIRKVGFRVRNGYINLKEV